MPTIDTMSCTTILVGKKASYDGSTIIARDDDSGSGRYDPKKFIAVAPQDQPRHYRSVLSHVEIDLPDNPCRYSIVPNVLPNRGILAEAGVNEHNVAMSATETIAVNERVLAADPLVELQPANEAANTPEVPGGIGEEDIITLVLPYVATAREGVIRLGELLETYGTYESNGVIISDVDDTVISTWLPRPMIAAWNSFVRDESNRQSIPGMARPLPDLGKLRKPRPDLKSIVTHPPKLNARTSNGPAPAAL